MISAMRHLITSIAVTGLLHGCAAGGDGSPTGGFADGGLASGPNTGGFQDPDGDGDGSGGDTGRAVENPARKLGDWSYYDVSGAKCRDGSPAGFFVRKGQNATGNLMIFFNGGGVCYDDFLCTFNPKNVDESMPGETIQNATLEVVTNLQVLKVAQTPVEEGIFKRDARNPVADWNMIYIPYCTGDIFGGAHPDAEIPGSLLQGKQQLVGWFNTGLMLSHFKKSFPSPKQVLVAGVSAGGMASLLNYDRIRETFSKSDVLAITDSGIPFRDEYMAVCLQKRWREMWKFDDIFPKQCSGCFRADGGGIVEGFGNYVFKQKYKGQFLGGGISTKQDQIIKLFFAMGNDNCNANSTLSGVGSFLTISPMPPEVFPAGLKDFIENVAGREQVGSYVMEGDKHQHIFRERFYQENGVGLAMNEWVRQILQHKPVHVGDL